MNAARDIHVSAEDAGRPRPLRRWSVAELIARALAQPRNGGLAH